jgi:hypothetical protein
VIPTGIAAALALLPSVSLGLALVTMARRSTTGA